MLVTRSHQIDTSQVNWDIAHLYEHLMIFGAKKYLDSKGINMDLFGWINGETFEERIFIDAGFYSDKVADLYDDYMGGVPHTLDLDLRQAASSVELEKKGRFILGVDDLRGEISNLMGLNKNSNKGRVLLEGSILKLSEGEFIDISVEIALTALSIADQKVFLRLRTILSDIIANYISKNFAFYERGVSPTSVSDNEAKFISVMTLYKSDTPKVDLLAKDLQNYIRNYPVDSVWADFETHFKEFASQPLWRAMTADYYRYTGLATTTEEICNLATKEMVGEMFSNIYINIQEATQSDIDLVE